jgi:hypothetical protein
VSPKDFAASEQRIYIANGRLLLTLRVSMILVHYQRARAKPSVADSASATAAFLVTLAPPAPCCLLLWLCRHDADVRAGHKPAGTVQGE